MTDEKAKLVKPNWDLVNLVADRLKLNRHNVQNVITLMDNGATIPFIARYRKEMTGDMGPDTLREVAAGSEELRFEKKLKS